jgi:exonuclease SbcD
MVRAVVTEPARAGLGDEVRAVLPGAVDIKVVAPALDRPAPRIERVGRSPHALFHAYLEERGIDDPRLEALFVDLYDAAAGPA